MSLEALTARLLARSGRGAKYGLERIRGALAAIGHPERQLACVHVAGTNGKGSTCAMIDAMARAAGLRVGVFTSPHLCQLNERIRLDGLPIDDDRFAAALEIALGAEPPVTFFEAMVIAGFVAMRDAAVDLAVFEVGLGGRLDATNVIPPPRSAAITSIGHDHTRLLGEDLPSIAREKAGIVKQGAPLVIGSMAAEARDAIVARAREVRSGPITAVATSDVEEDELRGDGLAVVRVHAEGTALRLTGALDLRVAEPALEGAHQRLNAAAAAATVAHLGAELALPLEAIRRGIAEVSWPGRLERIEREGVTVLLDCAHNLHAAHALQGALREIPVERTHLVFGALGDKDWRDMLALLGPRAAVRHYATPLEELAGRTPAAPEDLAAVLPGTVHHDRRAAIEAALAGARPGDTVVVTGSIFLVGAIRSHLMGETGDVAVPL